MATQVKTGPISCEIQIPPIGLRGALCVPTNAQSVVIFVHGSGSSRLSPRNIVVAEALNQHVIATLLFDLLTQKEEADRTNVFDIALLAKRLADVIEWKEENRILGPLPLGLFGASTGAAAALVAAAKIPKSVHAVVSRGGRPDLAGAALQDVRAPTLLIVGGADYGVIELNRNAFLKLNCAKALEIVPGATHLFEEPGALERVMDHATRWFKLHLLNKKTHI